MAPATRRTLMVASQDSARPCHGLAPYRTHHKGDSEVRNLTPHILQQGRGGKGGREGGREGEGKEGEGMKAEPVSDTVSVHPD